MDLQHDPVVIVSSACRLPLGITSPAQLWDAFCGNINSKDVFSSPSSVPMSRHSAPKSLVNPARVGGAGWLGQEGIEMFDPAFFNISSGEAQVLRPNTRLALELTWEVLERAGIPPLSLKGKNIAVSIGVGTEDGWDLRRFSDDDKGAFDHRWAVNSDPSGVSGQVAHFFDFRGPTFVVSTACSSGGFALRDGIQALLHEECELAIVGAVTTHFCSAPFDWAASVNVASKQGRCAAFSKEADGYVPSEGAVFLALRKASATGTDPNPVLGIIRSLSTGHNGATRALATPHVSAQVSLTRRSLRAAGLSPSDVTVLEAHGTGTRLGDAMEAEAFRIVFDNDEERREPLWVSSSKTLFGHCQAASMLVGILKVLACFEHKTLPPHLVEPLPEFKQGRILIPTSLVDTTKHPIIAQVCSFGFTGSIASLILEEPPETMIGPSTDTDNVTDTQMYLLPFSGKTTSALNAQISAVYEWVERNRCTLCDLGAILALAHDHHPVRLAVVASNIDELRGVSTETYTVDLCRVPVQESWPAALLNEAQLPDWLSEDDRNTLNELVEKQRILSAACLLYNKGHKLKFDEVYNLRDVRKLRQYLQTFPTYAFDRKWCWRDLKTTMTRLFKGPPSLSGVQGDESLSKIDGSSLSIAFVAESVASVLHIPMEDVQPESNIFDLGIDSLNSIELANTLSEASGVTIPVLELYSLLTVQATWDFIEQKNQGSVPSKATSQSQFSQADVNAWVRKYGAPLDTIPAPSTKKARSISGLSVLLTGANGMLGCHVLHDLLQRSDVAKVFCPIRGDTATRLSRAYSSYGYDDSELTKERETARLEVFRISNLGDDKLGCKPEVYRSLIENVDVIVHLAWKLDFNLPASSFQDCVEGTRNLAQLCLAANKYVAYYFISSFSAYFGHEDNLIPEQPLTANLQLCLDQGYAVSKLIAEHALFSMHRASNDAFSLKIVRIGQICGNSVTGTWSLNEMIPMMIQALPRVKKVPRNLPEVSWIPSDICAATITDFVVSCVPDAVEVLHVANPRITPWSTATEILGKFSGINEVSLVSLQQYVETVRNAVNRTELAIARLLPYFSGVIARGDLPSRYASLEVKESVAYSRALATCPEVDEEFLRPMAQILMQKSTELVEPASSDIRPLRPPVLLFAPWSESALSSMVISPEVKERVEREASSIRKQIQYEVESKPLDLQLVTLAGQLSAYEELKGRDMIPCAVLGYCFGEYAASVCAGILSLETAVEIVVRRAAVLHDIKGSMLNVFAELSVVKRQLLKLPFDMEIAIHAGPNHYVLSGSPGNIDMAQTAFWNTGIKTKLVETSIPFHSAVMDAPVMSLKLPEVVCSSENCTYISGLTGNSIKGKRLGPKYWLRHMRDPVLFIDAVKYIQKHFPSSPLVDVGPGRMLSSIISRYKWDSLEVLALSKFLSGDVFVTGTSHQVSLSLPSAISPAEEKPVSQLQSLRPQSSQPQSSHSVASVVSAEKVDRDRAESIVANILISEFGFEGSDPHDLVAKTFLMLGLQSLDFVAFSEKVLASTGISLPASTFASDSSLSELLAS